MKTLVLLMLSPHQQTDPMSSFTTPLRYENIDGTRLRILEAFEYRVGSEFSHEVIKVPAGFECDGQSYPRMLWFIDTPQGKGGKAGCIHDYLYWLNGRPMPETGVEYDRLRSDLIYREALAVSGVNIVSRNTRYQALRAFGWIAWNAHTRRINSK